MWHFFLRRYWTLNSLAQHLTEIRDLHSTRITEEFHLSSIQNHWSKFQRFLNYHGIVNLWDQPYLWRDSYWFVFWNGCTFGWRRPSLVAASWAYWQDDFYLWELLWFPCLFHDWITWSSRSFCDWVWTPNLKRTLKLSETSLAHWFPLRTFRLWNHDSLNSILQISVCWSFQRESRS